MARIHAHTQVHIQVCTHTACTLVYLSGHPHSSSRQQIHSCTLIPTNSHQVGSPHINRKTHVRTHTHAVRTQPCKPTCPGKPTGAYPQEGKHAKTPNTIRGTSVHTLKHSTPHTNTHSYTHTGVCVQVSTAAALGNTHRPAAENTPASTYSYSHTQWFLRQ